MAQGSASGRQVGGGMLVVAITPIVIGAVLWVGLGPDRGMDARTVVVACSFVVGGVALLVALVVVLLAGREPCRATRKDIVPFILLARLDDPGFAVRVDVADPQAVVIAWDQPVPGGAS
jgi:ABC-type antimicrobial peptide transport system permease subunit